MIELNKIYCGDCLEVMKQIEDNSIDIIITSPPYNKAGYEGFIRKRHSSDSWSKRNIDYGDDSNNDFMDESEYKKQQINIINEMTRIIKDDGNIFYIHKIRIANHKGSHPIEWILKTNAVFRQEIIRDRGSSPAVAPIRFLPTTERIYWLTKTNKQPNFRRIDGTSEVLRINADKGNSHPAPFPEELVYSILKHCGGELVLDCYMGSGTTAVVCNKLGKKWIGIEKEQKYIDIAKARIEATPTE